MTDEIDSWEGDPDPDGYKETKDKRRVYKKRLFWITTYCPSVSSLTWIRSDYDNVLGAALCSSLSLITKLMGLQGITVYTRTD